MENVTKTLVYGGVKSGYHSYSIAGLRGTVYVPKGYFAANAVPENLQLTAPFVAPVAPAATVNALQAEIAALKAQLAAGTQAPTQPENAAPPQPENPPVVVPPVENPPAAQGKGKKTA